MTLRRKLFNGITLWLGMYAITVFIYWLKVGHFYDGLLFALMTASAKTVWSLVHKAITHREPSKVIITEEALPTSAQLEAEVCDCKEAA
jgi:hypothetical protein